MIKYTALIAFIINTLTSFAQRPLNHEDVAVIVNTRSNNSIAIGNYFKTARSIPDENMVYVDVDSSETVAFSVVQDLINQIEDTIIARGLENKFNYLVTTKGVPLKHNQSGGSAGDYSWARAGVDAELRMILNPDLQTYIGAQYPVTNPYYLAREYFSRKKYGIFLVTRLTGYSVGTVKRMIDSSGTIQADKAKATFILDGTGGAGGYGSSEHNTTSLVHARDTLLARGWNNVVFDQTSLYIQNESNVLGYWSWGVHESSVPGGYSAKPTHTWHKGAIAETAVSSGGRTYKPSACMADSCYGQSKMADWLENGASGVSSFVQEPLLTSVCYPGPMMDRLTDEKYVFNLAEVYHMASWLPLSYQQAIIGDPKSSIYGFTPSVPAPSVTILTDTIDQSTTTINACEEQTIQLVAYNWSPGNSNWFIGDASSVTSNGTTYTSVHKDFVASGDTFWLDSTFIPGTYAFTYINENIAGIAMKEMNLTINPTPTKPIITRGGDVLVSSQTNGTFQWGQYNIPDGKFYSVPGANNSSLIPPIPAVYNVEYTDLNGCKNTSDGYNFTGFTGIENINTLLEQPNIYPNPSTNLLNIDFKSNTAISAISINNLLGKTIYRRTTNNKHQLLQLNTGNFSNGIYNINYWSKNNTLLTKQSFVISR